MLLTVPAQPAVVGWLSLTNSVLSFSTLIPPPMTVEPDGHAVARSTWAPAGMFELIVEYVIGTFTTRKNGSGNLHVFLEGDRSGHVPVAVNNAANQTVLLGP